MRFSLHERGLVQRLRSTGTNIRQLRTVILFKAFCLQPIQCQVYITINWISGSLLVFPPQEREIRNEIFATSELFLP